MTTVLPRFVKLTDLQGFPLYIRADRILAIIPTAWSDRTTQVYLSGDGNIRSTAEVKETPEEVMAKIEPWAGSIL